MRPLETVVAEVGTVQPLRGQPQRRLRARYRPDSQGTQGGGAIRVDPAHHSDTEAWAGGQAPQIGRVGEVRMRMGGHQTDQWPGRHVGVRTRQFTREQLIAHGSGDHQVAADRFADPRGLLLPCACFGGE